MFNFLGLLLNLLRLLLNLLRLPFNLLVLPFDKLLFLFNHFILQHDGRISGLYLRQDFILHFHGSSHLRSDGGFHEPSHYQTAIVSQSLFIQFHQMFIILQAIFLIKHLKDFLQAVPETALQVRNLDDDTVMRQTFDERIGNAVGYRIGIVIQVIPSHIDDRLFQIAQLMAQYVDGDDGNTVPVRIDILGQHILLIQVLGTQILSETQRLRGEPGLLQFNENQLCTAILVTDGSGKIYPQHGDAGLHHLRILMGLHLEINDVFLQQSGKQNLGDPVVFHHVLEHRVVNGVCYQCHGLNL